MPQYGDETATDATNLIDMEITSYVGDTDSDSTTTEQKAACSVSDFVPYHRVHGMNSVFYLSDMGVVKATTK